MKITLKRMNFLNEDYGQTMRLYKSAFPFDERVPMWFLALKSGAEYVDFWGIYADGKWIGLAYVISEKNVSYLFYFALSDDMRGKGFGSKAMQSLKNIMQGKSFFLRLSSLTNRRKIIMNGSDAEIFI